VHKREAEILQIRKYLNGELDAKAMHQLERRAQDDPFLMDALEGYGLAKADQQKQLDELSARLKSRIEPKKGRVIPFRFLSIAASVLVLCMVGVWWYYSSDGNARKEKVLATNLDLQKPAGAPADIARAPVAPPVKPAEKDKTANASKKPAHTIHAIVAADRAVTEKPPTVRDLVVSKPAGNGSAGSLAPADSTPVDEMIVMEYKAKKNVDTSSFARKAPLVTIADKTPAVQQLPGKAPGVTIRNNNAREADLNKLAGSGGVAGGLALSQLLNNQSIQGRVIAQDDGLPVQGASVTVAGTNKVTKTDAEGRFQLKADSGRSKLVIAGPGYQTRQVNANNRDSVKNIALEPGESSLSEVVVTGYTSQNKEADEHAAVVKAHPKIGWAEFKKYLKANAVSPDHKNGVVKLSFMVNSDGGITDIKVIKGISQTIDKKAADLVKTGPQWVPNSGKRPERVYLRIRFVN
jgi:hypothetical protein